MLKKILVLTIIGYTLIWAQDVRHSDVVIERSALSTDDLQLNNKSSISEQPLMIMEKMKAAMKRSHQYPIIEHFGNETAGEPTKIDIIPQVKRLIKDNSEKLEDPILYGDRNEGNVSTSPSGSSTWLGGWGTGGCTNGQSWWYRHILKPYESIVWVLEAEYETADYDLILWDYPNHSTILAGAWSTTYPDTLYYTNNSSSNLWVFLEVDFYSGNQNDIFYISNVRCPISSSDPHILTNYALRGEPNPNNPTDGIEGYHPYLPSERSHWYIWTPYWSTGFVKLCLRDVANEVDYDLYVYDQYLNLITSATGVSYPDVTGWIDCSVYYGEPIYLEVYAYETTCAEYRVDYYDYNTGIEENRPSKPFSFGFHSVLPSPTRNISSVKYSISQGGYVNLSLYDARGRKIATLVNRVQSTGMYTISVDLSNHRLPNGIYFYRLESNGFIETEKVVLLK